MTKRAQIPQPKIDLQELLHDKPEWADVAEFWKLGEFHEEHYLVDAILKHLLTPEQSAAMSASGFTIEDLLNGRTFPRQEPVREKILTEWNAKLGFKAFYGGVDPQASEAQQPCLCSHSPLDHHCGTGRCYVCRGEGRTQTERLDTDRLFDLNKLTPGLRGFCSRLKSREGE